LGCWRENGAIDTLLTVTDANPAGFPGVTGEFQARRVRDLTGRGELGLTQKLIALVIGTAATDF
jgi:hypothetical protein